MAGIFDLPPEVHDIILRQLKYLDLGRFSARCRQASSHLTADIRRQALTRLEDDLVDAGFRADHEDGYYSEMLEGGYLRHEIAKIVNALSPCYTCLRFRKNDDFELVPTNAPLQFKALHAFTSNSRKQEYPLPGPSGIRECVPCTLESVDLAKSKPRFLATQKYRIVACVGCDLIKKTTPVVCRRQEVAEVCDQCFGQEKAKWYTHMHEVRIARDKLNRYLNWMEGVENDVLPVHDPAYPETCGVSLPPVPTFPGFEYLW
jgi:hypothetical protein